MTDVIMGIMTEALKKARAYSFESATKAGVTDEVKAGVLSANPDVLQKFHDMAFMAGALSAGTILEQMIQNPSIQAIIKAEVGGTDQQKGVLN